MDFESTEDSGSLQQIVQRMLVRRARYWLPIAERKHEAAEPGCHPVHYDIAFPHSHATGPGSNPSDYPGFFPIDYRPDTFAQPQHFSNPIRCFARPIDVPCEHPEMNSIIKFALVSVVFASMSLVPAYASSHKSGSSHTRSQTYHDRTPKAATHGSHPHHG
jgi:hypothetical protein